MKVFIKTKHETDVPQVTKMHTRTQPVISNVDNKIIIADLTESEINSLREQEAFEIFEDIQFQPTIFLQSGAWWEREIDKPQVAAPPPWMSKTQADVMEHNTASTAWMTTRGRDVTIAVVDTGTDGSMSEFTNRSPHSYAPSFNNPWEDSIGHGTMCAAIACGNKTNGGRYDGVAPEAMLLTARTTLASSDLYLIYQRLLSLKRGGEFANGLVVSNSYGFYTCSPPNFPQGHPYMDLIKQCVADGIVFVFAAGNNHAAGLCNHPDSAAAPNTIWAVNGIDEVITVGTVDWDESNQQAGGEHANSSRGPGQWSTRQDKPDVVAPTYGEVAWGGNYRRMEWWGTSGACPQVAGLAALILSQDPTLTPDQVRMKIRSKARNLVGKPTNCVGSGMIDCGATV